jgi:hypothetical protein
MRGERLLLRTGEYLVGRACQRLPPDIREERYREWSAELPAILHDPQVRPAPRDPHAGLRGGHTARRHHDARQGRRSLIVLLTDLNPAAIEEGLLPRPSRPSPRGSGSPRCSSGAARTW